VKHAFRLLSVAAICAMAPALAQAAPITFQFSVEVTSLTNASSGQILTGQSVAIGNILTGSLTLESSTPDTYSSDPVFGRYEHTAAPSALMLNTAAPVISNAFIVNISNGYPGPADTFSLTTTSNPSAGLMTFNFGAPAGGLWPTDALPQSGIPALQLASLNSQFTLTKIFNGDTHLLTAKIRSFDVGQTTPPAVPEPTSMVLLGTGLVGLVRLRKRTPKA
jgi:hypothetical protein